MEEQDMSSESQTNEEENNAQSKQDHIKERLKEMGVSDDSVRPEKSLLSKFSSYVIALIVIVLMAGFWLESNRQDDSSEQVAVSDESYNTEQQYNQMPYAGHQQDSWGNMADNQQSNTGWAEQNQPQNNEAMQQGYNPYYQPQYPAYAQSYNRPNYYGYYQPRPQVAPDNTYRNMQQPYAGNYQAPAGNNYAYPYGRQPYYYNGWQQ